MYTLMLALALYGLQKALNVQTFICLLRIQISILPLMLPATPTFMFAQAHLYTQMCG